MRALLRGGIPADTVAASGEFAGKTALELLPPASAAGGGAPSAAQQVRCAFTAEALQSVVMGDAERAAALLRAGVRPTDRVGPQEDDKTLLEWAEDLLEPAAAQTGGSRAESECLALIRAHTGKRVAVKGYP